jgi:hypothetical protein
MPGEEVSRGLHHRDHARGEGWFTDGRRHQLADDLPASLAQPAEQLAVVEEVRAQHLRYREGPQAVPYLLEYLFGQQRSKQRPALGGARGAEPPPLTGERHQVLATAVVAAHPREARSKMPQSRNA